MEQLSTLNTSELIDYDNLNIITHPRPPRRRQSGASLIPFRPYVKCLTGVREPFAYADGKEKWMTTGKKEIFFKQNNGRCIGTLIEDCDISDVIRWDIEGESTRLPMMCKLWMIVDGAVVERGKPHLVQDAAVQVFTAGRNRRSVLAAEQRSNPTSTSTFDRRRRHSWHDVNEYHSVPYYQYTRAVRSGDQHGIQCDLDNEHVTSTQEYLPFLLEETVEEDQLNDLQEQTAFHTVHHRQSIPQDQVQISMMTQTEHCYVDRATEIESDFVILFNLNLQTNENLLSSIVNPYNRDISFSYSWETTKIIRHGIEYINRSVSTGDDYPSWWVQLSTNVLLSNRLTNQGEEKKKSLSIPSARQQFDQSIQTDVEFHFENEIEKTQSLLTPRIQTSSSSITINDNYEIIDQTNDGNNSRRLLSFHDQRQRIDSDSHLSDYQIEICSNREQGQRSRQRTTSSKQSDSDYHTFTSTLNQQSYSTPDPHRTQTTSMYSSTNELEQRKQTKSSESTSTNMLATLLERYERTLKERQRAITIVNNQILDIDHVLQRYRQKIEDPQRAVQLYEDITFLARQAKEDDCSSSLNLSRLTRDKYRTMPALTSEEMLEGYIPSPRLYITNSSRHRQPRFDYCELCLTDHNTSSAWIRYNEQRIDQLQKRIDFMLQIDDKEQNQLFSTTDTITQRINDILINKSKRRTSIVNHYHNRILLPRRYNFRYPYRLTSSLPSSPRLLTRNLIRKNNLTSKSVRISTLSDQIHLREPSKSISQPIVSILRRPTPKLSPRSPRLTETSHIWKDENDGKVYILKQFSIPRYYRLYNDVSFREVYNFSRILETFFNKTTSESYSSIVKNFAVNQQLPTISSVA